jgi:hypothetical protein
LITAGRARAAEFTWTVAGRALWAVYAKVAGQRA